MGAEGARMEIHPYLSGQRTENAYVMVLLFCITVASLTFLPEYI